MRFLRTAVSAGFLCALGIPAITATAFADSPPVVIASIKPIHSLVAAVMQGVAEPTLIVEGAASPHSYALKPSQAAKLSKATHVFWMGHALEAFLEKPIETVGAHARAIELLETPGLTKLAFREGGAFEPHHHDDDDHEKHDHAEHGDGDHDEPDHEGHGHDGNDHDGVDPHVWLDPVNATALVRHIASVLSQDDPANAEIYAANAVETAAAIEKLTNEISESLAPMRDKGFVVFHDGYHYFEERFGVHAVGSITVSPEVAPGAERVREIQHRVKELGASCVFAEPQFEPRLISVVLEGSTAKSGTLDPLGADLKDGPTLYFNLIRNMAASMRDCLS